MTADVCAFGVVECLCGTRRAPDALPERFHRTRNLVDFRYRAAFGGSLAKTLGTIAHSPIRIKR